VRDPDIEAWALRALDQARAGAQSEDARVELKQDWGEPGERARRLAGLANASRGDPALWIVGADENGTVVGVEGIDFATWWQQMVAQFDGLAPDIRELAVPVSGHTVVAILVETTRAPFVVKNPQFGVVKGHTIQLEVPWREGTAVRTARREDLVRLLVPQARLPTFELRSAQLEVNDRLGHVAGPAKLVSEAERYHWTLDIDVYAENVTSELVLPDHRCQCELRASPTGGWGHDFAVSGSAGGYWIGGGSDLAATSARGHGQLIVHGPGPLHWGASTTTSDGPFSHATNFDGRLILGMVGLDEPLRVAFELIPVDPRGAFRRWRSPEVK
jgi:hypothetical protein